MNIKMNIIAIGVVLLARVHLALSLSLSLSFSLSLALSSKSAAFGRFCTFMMMVFGQRERERDTVEGVNTLWYIVSTRPFFSGTVVA